MSKSPGEFVDSFLIFKWRVTHERKRNGWTDRLDSWNSYLDRNIFDDVKWMKHKISKIFFIVVTNRFVFCRWMPKNGNYFLFFSLYKVFITCFFNDQYSHIFKKIVEKYRVIKGIYGTDIQTSCKEKIVQQLRISYSFFFPFFYLSLFSSQLQF